MKSTKWLRTAMRCAVRSIVRCCALLFMALWPLICIAGRFTVSRQPSRPSFWLDFTHGYSKLWKVLRNGFI